MNYVKLAHNINKNCNQNVYSVIINAFNLRDQIFLTRRQHILCIHFCGWR